MSHPVSLSLFILAGIIISAVIISALPRVKDLAQKRALEENEEFEEFISSLKEHCSSNASLSAKYILPPMEVKANGSAFVVVKDDRRFEVNCSTSPGRYVLRGVYRYSFVWNNSTGSWNLTLIGGVDG